MVPKSAIFAPFGGGSSQRSGVATALATVRGLEEEAWAFGAADLAALRAKARRVAFKGPEADTCDINLIERIEPVERIIRSSSL